MYWPLLLLIGLPLKTLAGSLNFEISLEQRQFVEEQGPEDSFDQDTTMSLAPDWSYDGDLVSLRFSMLGRYAANDQNRTRLILRDNLIQLEKAGVSLEVGTKTYTWTNMEAFQTAEVVNSREWDGNLENFYRLGEWVVELSHGLFGGELHWMYMPIFTPPILPSDRSRLGFGVDFDRAIYFSADGEFYEDRLAPQFALRYEKSTARVDGSIFALQHVDRNFFLVGTPEFSEPLSGVFAPIGSSTQPMYFMTRKVGGSLVYAATDSIILKTEALYKDFLSEAPVLTQAGLAVPEDYGLASLGFEKSFNFLKGIDQSLIIEHQRLFGLEKSERLSTEVFQNDIFLAWRFSFRGLNEKELQMGWFYDLEQVPQNLFIVSYGQRWNESFKWKAGYRHFDAPIESGLSNLRVYNKDHHVYFTLTANY